MYAAFAHCGLAVLFINYRGSLGFGQVTGTMCVCFLVVQTCFFLKKKKKKTKKDFLEALPGHVGSMDVQDCNDAVTRALAHCADLDASKVAVFGGSHGGLLAAHLTAQFPDRYGAAVMRNPVCVPVTRQKETEERKREERSQITLWK